MKKLLLISMIALTMTACTRKQEHSAESYREEVKHITNQFVYKASERGSVKVVEFINASNKKCVIVHANYDSDSTLADISCPTILEPKSANYEKNEVVKQFTYTSGGNPVQVTMIRTINNLSCTIVHANYEYSRSSASITCE